LIWVLQAPVKADERKRTQSPDLLALKLATEAKLEDGAGRGLMRRALYAGRRGMEAPLSGNAIPDDAT